MKTKKIISASLSVVLVASLCACGSPDRGTTASEATEAPAVVETEVPENDAKQLREDFKVEIGGSGLTYYNSVRNDETGNWRVAVIYTAENMVDHALNYYKAYFEDDSEIHFVVNLGLKTTTEMSVVLGNLQVDVYEYVDKEEHDANLLASGLHLKSYWIDLESGEIEDLSTE